MLPARVKRSVQRRVRFMGRRIGAKLASRMVQGTPGARRSRPHGLPSELVISLTSHPGRFDRLDHTIRSLLNQNTRPDQIWLWVDDRAESKLPAEVRELRRFGLNIGTHRDIGPATKLIPALKKFPGAFIITADDDFYYPRGWVERLVRAYDHKRPAIVAMRAHMARVDGAGRLLPYREWETDTRAAGPGEAGEHLFPTGVGGVLYPPGCFGPEVLNEDALLALTPKADDVWFFWMARMNGFPQVRVPGSINMITWPGSQERGLLHGNVHSAGNDVQIAAMERAYGLIGGAKPVEIRLPEPSPVPGPVICPGAVLAEPFPIPPPASLDRSPIGGGTSAA